MVPHSPQLTPAIALSAVPTIFGYKTEHKTLLKTLKGKLQLKIPKRIWEDINYNES
jgi:hypothetical protein